ncbi:MAG: DinB family protein [Acidimicrobiales bacterium]|nr:DinB family protein [Acidimicrobiales bacterium]
MHRCDECRFEYASEDEASIPDRLRTLGRRYQAPLSRFLPGEDGPGLLRSHPADGAWSALEYACHVRDVFEVQRQRLEQTLVQDQPAYGPMGREERVVDLAYNEQPPAEVAQAVAANAEALAASFEGLTAEQWARTGIYGFPERAERSLLWLGQHTVHEAHHHLLDLGRTMRSARGR